MIDIIFKFILSGLAVISSFVIGCGLYFGTLEPYDESPSLSHCRFWLCQILVAIIYVGIYLTETGVIIW
jgi:hypothetical protein